MSSAIPYDPDEFDNNPFAEPPAPAAAASSAAAPAQQEDHQEDNQDDQDDQNNQDNQEHAEPDNKKAAINQPALPEALIPERLPEAQQYKISIKVTGLERAGSLSSKKENPAIIFDVKTNIPHFRKKTYKGVKKSYAEFHSFFKFLNGANPECFVPSLPISSTNYGVNSEEDYKKTVQNFQTWFNRVSLNPILIRNEEFVFFIETDFNSYSPINKSKLPASGLKRKTLKQFQPPYDEVLELAEFRPLIKSIYQVISSIHHKLEKLSKTRKAYAISENKLGEKIGEFNQLENFHPGMQLLWKKFGKTITTQGDLDSIIGSLDMATFGDGLQAIIDDSYVIKEALTNRHLWMRDLINAQANTKSKHENARRLRDKKDINPIKVDEAIRSLQEATEYEEELTKKIKRITENMLIEKTEYLKLLDEEIKQIFKEFVVKRIEYERRKLSVLEKVRVDVRLVDENGGLARLGREQYPKKKILSTTSQTPDGDSWNGDRKVSHVSEEIFKQPTDTQDDELPVGVEEDPEENLAIDARNAASLLGGSTF